MRLRLRQATATTSAPFGAGFDRVFRDRIAEADEFYAERVPAGATAEERRVLRQGYAGLLWSKQFYHYVTPHWLEGDPSQPAPPAGRDEGRNAEWPHVYNRDIISMPDKWEYPWFAAWDLAFHMIPFARIDPQFAKEQLLLLLREWYMHPNGQIPAYEFAFGDVNPPVHAWACWRVYKMTGAKGQRDRLFLERAFQKLLLNFTWWVNRKDPEGRNLFAGGFLGLDNIGVFDRSRPLPTGGHLEQADGTAWMAFYCNTMLSMALELASEDPAYEDLASKFFEHFIAIAQAINTLGGSGLWCEDDGFYYDQLHVGDRHEALRVRSLVGLMPLIAAEVLDEGMFEHLEGFRKRMNWFLENRRDVTSQIACMMPRQGGAARAAAAGHPGPRAPGARAPVPAGRERVSLPARDPVGVAGASRAPVRDRGERRDPSCGLRAGGRHQRALRRQLELAWAGVVSDQLPGPRGAGALPPLLRERPQGGVPRRVGPNAEPPGGRLGARGPAGLAVPAGCIRPAALPWRGRALRRRSALEGPGAVPRVLPRGQRTRRRGQPPDRVDRARAPLHRGPGAPARRTGAGGDEGAAGRLAGSRR